MSSIVTSQITSITSASLTAEGGADLAFPKLSQFSEPNGATIEATGGGSDSDLTALTSLTGASGYASLNINADSAGEVNLSNITSLPSGRIYAHADGTSSVIDFSKLAELDSDAEYDSGFEASNGGSILAGALTTLNRGDIQLDDSKSSITTSQITSITSSNLTVEGGGDLAFPKLSQISEPDGATLEATGGGSDSRSHRPHVADWRDGLRITQHRRPGRRRSESEQCDQPAQRPDLRKRPGHRQRDRLLEADRAGFQRRI